MQYYSIGFYWEGKNEKLAFYTFGGKEIFYCTDEDIEEFLQYVKKNNPNHEYFIFKLNPKKIKK